MAAIMLTVAAVCVVGCTKSDAPNNNGNNNGGNGGNSINGHEYVDLGLPSGNLWATGNVGVTTTKGYGDYFAWGEIQTKSYYAWSTYKYCKGDFNQLTKYCASSSYGYNGFTDTLTILQPGDDAAAIIWGSGWRMPTVVEWEELYLNTTSTFTTRDNVKGRLFTASNGQSLFLPLAGVRWQDNLDGVGLIGDYWSSFANASTAPYFAIDTGRYCAGIAYGNRSDGFSVRAVHSSCQD